MYRLQASALCDAVVREPKAAAQPNISAALERVRASLDVNSSLPLAVALCSLSMALLEGMPFRLTRTAMQTLLNACEKAYAGAAASEQRALLDAASPLWAPGLVHLNRDVRSSTLAIAMSGAMRSKWEA